MGWLRVLTKVLFYFVNWSSHRPPPRNCPLHAIAIALAALAITRILTCHPCCHRHCPLFCRRRCLPSNLVTVSIALPPSPSLLLATLIAATVLTAAIALVVACPAPLLPSPLILPPSPLPSSLLANLIAIAIALFVASAFTRLPPSSPLCRAASGGGGEDHTDPVRDPTLAATIGAAIIVAAFAIRTTGREGTVQRCTGFQCPEDSLRRRSGAAVGIHVAGTILLADQRQRRRQQRADGGGSGVVGNAATK
jgi:hypothetical protein